MDVILGVTHQSRRYAEMVHGSQREACVLLP